jgi:hypothetical protein
VMHALLAHVGEVHRRTRRVLGIGGHWLYDTAEPHSSVCQIA